MISTVLKKRSLEGKLLEGREGSQVAFNQLAAKITHTIPIEPWLWVSSPADNCLPGGASIVSQQGHVLLNYSNIRVDHVPLTLWPPFDAELSPCSVWLLETCGLARQVQSFCSHDVAPSKQKLQRSIWPACGTQTNRLCAPLERSLFPRWQLSGKRPQSPLEQMSQSPGHHLPPFSFAVHVYIVKYYLSTDQCTWSCE